MCHTYGHFRIVDKTNDFNFSYHGRDILSKTIELWNEIFFLFVFCLINWDNGLDQWNVTLIVFLFYMLPSGTYFIYTAVFSTLPAEHPLTEMLNDPDMKSQMILVKLYHITK